MPDLSEAVPLLAFLVAIGAMAGVLAGLLGVGGGIILVPAFYYAFSSLGYGGDYIMQISIATSLATIVVTSLRSVASHNRKGAVQWDTLKGWAPGIVAGAILGVSVTTVLRTSVLQGVFGVLALLVGSYMLLARDSWRLGEAMPTGALRHGFAMAVGGLSVVMGIGGGAFGVTLQTLFGRPIHQAVATAAGFGVLIAVPSVVLFLFVNPPTHALPPYTVGVVNLIAFAIIVGMTLLTAPLGVWLAHRTDPRPLKRYFAVFLIFMALNMIRKAVGWS
ncbi:sulfite exporter TauE/SafE family protein [Meridianimarinicoccus sp. MJW13]|uniref:sulfite exporter TauE/SafE family protein n=1 Tax=Meridianimarinicoccus sp. MJW13 TaxID=2720031 RepID=UPI00299F8D03|nr:sulfite exporter TauE/SafE family protein [Fluviibacterium sp. MJW13]